MKIIKTCSLLILTHIFACYSKDKINRAEIKITSLQKLNFGSNAYLIISIYGVDVRWSDVSATLLFDDTIKINKIPIKYKIEINENWVEKIKPNHGTKSKFRFYVDVSSNRFYTDFKKTNNGNGLKSVSDLNEISQTIYIKNRYEAP